MTSDLIGLRVSPGVRSALRAIQAQRVFMTRWPRRVSVCGVALLAAAATLVAMAGPAGARSSVPKLTKLWTAHLIGPGTAPVVGGGEVFVTAIDPLQPKGPNAPGSDLYAFSATCPPAPAQCSRAPVWVHGYPTVSIAGTRVPAELTPAAVGAGNVYVGWNQQGADEYVGPVQAFAGATGAAVFSAGQGGTSTPSVGDGIVASNWQIMCCLGQYNFSGTESLDASTGASLWTTDPTDGPASSPPTVGAGSLFLGSGSALAVFDASGKVCAPNPSDNPTEIELYLNATGFPEVCAPLWYDGTGGNITGAATVAGGEVYVGASDGVLYAFPAAGCGSSSCSADWTTIPEGAITTSVAVTATTVFVGSSNGVLSAYPVGGCGPTPCAPEWTATIGGSLSAPAVAGSLVYVTSTNQQLDAFPVAGCGSPTCGPTWQAHLHAPSTTAPAAGAGVVFVTDTDHRLYAFRQP